MKKKQLRVNPGACLPLIGRRVSSCLAYPRPVWKKHLIAREQEEKDQRYQHLEIRAQKLPDKARSFFPRAAPELSPPVVDKHGETLLTIKKKASISKTCNPWANIAHFPPTHDASPRTSQDGPGHRPLLRPATACGFIPAKCGQTLE
ncbi:hypothetical protein [Bordetella trematum]|uniref:hypothetical protein n=1 Tax=Bordetella trematum TaxID=123899 RepID=UPI003D0E2DB4